MFLAALRVLELISIRASDVIISDRSVKILIGRSKTDQLGKVNWLHLHALDNSKICPVLLVKKYYVARPLKNSKFFLHESGLPLTKYQFTSVLKKCLKLLKLDHAQLTSHSFIIGAATKAARLGLDVNKIKKIGRWKSNSYLLNVHPNHSL